MLYSCENSILRKKSGTSPWEISVPCTSRNARMIQHLIIQFSFNYPSTVHSRGVKNKTKFQTFSSKRMWSRSLKRGDGLREVSNIVIWLGKFWYSGKLVADERWLQPEVRRYFAWDFDELKITFRHWVRCFDFLRNEYLAAYDIRYQSGTRNC